MIRAFRSELVKVLRRRPLALAAGAVLLVSVGGAAIVLAAAGPAATATPGRGVTLEALADAGGGTEVFRTAVSFAGFFVFVVFTGAVAVEFSRGTFRTMLLRQPRRLRLLAGKTAALVTFAAGVLAATEVLTWISARLLAPSQGVSTADWTSLAAAGQALTDYGAVLFWVTGYAALGTALAVLVRSVPVALAVGIAWAGPFEHLLQDAWAPASRLFPGLLLEAVAAGGTPDVSSGRAFLMTAIYLAVAAGVAGFAFARRDAVT